MRTIIDTHCHPQLSQYDADREQVIRRAIDAGVGMICVGVDLASSQSAIILAEQYEGLYASVGLHPNDNLDEKYDQATYEKLATHPKVVAIGEVGLDYYRTTDQGKRAFQMERLLQQIELAQRIDKPLIIHCRDSLRPLLKETNAHTDMLRVLPDYRGVIHSFTGTFEQATAYIEKGYMIGFNGIITFAPEYDDLVRRLPLDRILLETDAPFLTPVPHRGTRNEPAHVVYVAEKIAELRGISVAEVKQQTIANTLSLFSIV